MKKVNIKIIGVGSGGINTIDKYKRIDKDINTIALHTDSKLLDNVTVSQKLLLRGGTRGAFKTTIYPHQVKNATLVYAPEYLDTTAGQHVDSDKLQIFSQPL